MADKRTIEALQAQIDSLLDKQRAGYSQIDNQVFDEYEPDDRGYSGIGAAKGHRGASRRTGKDREASGADAAFKKIIALVNVSDRSELSVRERLKRDGYQDEHVEIAVNRAKDYGFIDDMRFSEVLIRSRISQNKGSAGIVRELASNGIDALCVPGWPYDYPVSADDEIDRALALLERKPPRSKNLREGAYRRLMQKGYPSSVSSTAARLWSEGLDSKRYRV